MKKSRSICVVILICCVLVSGCSAITEHGKYYFSVFGWMIDSIWEKREHDCDITVKNADGEILYKSSNKENINYFADLVEQLDENDLETFYQGEVLYEYIVRDNDKTVSFGLYSPGDILSCGVGKIQAYYRLSDETKEILIHPENWMEMQ